MRIPVEVWVQPYRRTEQTRVTHAVFTYVALDDNGRPIPVIREEGQTPSSFA
jgi:acyl-CoA thioesterase YciA